MSDGTAASSDLITGLLLARLVQISWHPHKVFFWLPLLTMHQAACTCLQVAAAAEQHARLTDTLEETHQARLTLDTVAPAIAVKTIDNACIDLTEDNDMDMAPAAGQFACGCVRCFFMSPNACRCYPCCIESWL